MSEAVEESTDLGNEESNQISTSVSPSGISDQAILLKIVVSLGINICLTLVAALFGAFFRLFFTLDLGLVLLWGNQFMIIFLFLVDKRGRDSNEMRMNKLTALELITLACQVAPVFWTRVLWDNPFLSYWGFTYMLLLQELFKLIYMKFFGTMMLLSL